MALRTPQQQQSSADRGDDDDGVGAGLFAEVNITPLTDVILVLLIIFMVSSSAMVDAAREGRLDVDLPTAAASANALAQKTPLVVSILKDGRVALAGDVLPEEDLGPKVKQALDADATLTTIIDADGEVEHRIVVHVIDLLHQAGIKEVGIGVAPEGG